LRLRCCELHRRIPDDTAKNSAVAQLDDILIDRDGLQKIQATSEARCGSTSAKSLLSKMRCLPIAIGDSVERSIDRGDPCVTLTCAANLDEATRCASFL
jgi:hypothetical protein